MSFPLKKSFAFAVIPALVAIIASFNALGSRSLCRAEESEPVPPRSGAAVALSPIPVIFDTDMDTDCDDAGALAILHAMADQGEIEILATVVSSRYNWSVPCVQAINSYYGRPNLPIGAPKGDGASDRRGSSYAKQIAERFPTQFKTNADAPDAVVVYRKALAAAKDKSVVLVTVGYLTNIKDLLESDPDEISPLSGRALAEKKIVRFACMGGRYPESMEPGEWGNFRPDPKAICFVAEQFPGTISFSGDGDRVPTGGRLAQTAQNNPVRVVYELYLKGQKTRPSWDPVALFYGVRPHLDCWKITQKGYNQIYSNGTNRWIYEQDSDQNAASNRRHELIQIQPGREAELAQTMDELMVRAPGLKKNNDRPAR